MSWKISMTWTVAMGVGAPQAKVYVAYTPQAKVYGSV